jgi:hypothetical protein
VPNNVISRAFWQRVAAGLLLGSIASVAIAQTPPPVTPAPGLPPTAQTSVPPSGANLPTEELPDDGLPEDPVTKTKPKAKPAVPAPVRPFIPGALGQAPVTNGAVLQALDKVTARVTRLEVGLGQTVQFGTLRITARACAMRPPEEPPESSAFLEIVDSRKNPAGTAVFSGWMFASSPALSALEHPSYDVWVTACRTAAAPPGPGGGAKR